MSEGKKEDDEDNKNAQEGEIKGWTGSRREDAKQKQH